MKKYTWRTIICVLLPPAVTDKHSGKRAKLFVDCIGADRYLIKEVNTLNPSALQQVKEVPGVNFQNDYDGNLHTIAIHRSHIPVFLKSFPFMEFEEYPCRRNNGKAQLPYRLRDYQMEAVNFIASRTGVLLAHDMGMGKTPIVLTAAIYPALVLVPNTAITVWEKEALNANLNVQIIKGQKADPKMLSHTTDLFILTYGSAKYWLPYFKALSSGPSLSTVIADEAHYIQKMNVQATKAFRSVGRELTIMATATPVPNRLSSLWGVLNGASPGAWGWHGQYRQRYCGAIDGRYGGLIDTGPTHTEELASRVQEVMIRRTWDEPGFSALRPKLERTIQDLDISLDARVKLVDDAIQSVFKKLKTAGSNAVTLRFLTAQRQQLGLLKAQAVIEAGVFDDGSPARHMGARREIIYVWHKDTANYIAKELMARCKYCPVDVLMGTSTGKHRKAVLKEWEDGSIRQPRILVATLATASESVNLITADTAYFLEFDWAPRRVIQAEARHYRPGNQNKTVYAHYVTLRGTMEDRIIRALLEKVEHHEAALGPDGQRVQIAPLLEEPDLEFEETGDVLEDLAHRLMIGK